MQGETILKKEFKLLMQGQLISDISCWSDSNDIWTHSNLARKRTPWPLWPNGWAMFWILICTTQLTVCYYHVITSFRVNPHSIVCLNVSERNHSKLNPSLSTLHSQSITQLNWNLGTQSKFSSLSSFAKWLSVRLQTKWFWVQISLLSLKLHIWRRLQARSSLTFWQTIQCEFNLKLVHVMVTVISC